MKRPYSMTTIGGGLAAIVFWTGGRLEIVRPYIKTLWEDQQAREHVVWLNNSFQGVDIREHYESAFKRHKSGRNNRYPYGSLRWWQAEHDYWSAKLDALTDDEDAA